MKKIIPFVIISIIFVVLSPFTAYAYSNEQKLEVDFYNFVDKAYYIELLIKMECSGFTSIFLIYKRTQCKLNPKQKDR